MLHFYALFCEDGCICCYQCVFLSLVYSIARFFISFNVSFKNIRASSALLPKKQSSTYQYRQDGGGSKQNRVRTANSQLKNEHGRSFFSVPAGVFFLRLESAPPIFKKADFYRAFISSTESPDIVQISLIG